VFMGGEELKTPKTKWKWKHDLPEPFGHSKESTKRKVYSYEILHFFKKSEISHK
jgi:hypothetical protein